MPQPDTRPTLSELRKRALSRWDNEGGAIASAPQATSLDEHELTNAELIHLRIRVIALENMMIAVLAEGSDRQIEVAREMADYISPRPGFTPHPLTLQAADHMKSFVERALHFRTEPPMMDEAAPYKSTPVFNESTLPAGLRKEHRTKSGVWGVIRLLSGQVRYRVLDPVSESILDPYNPGLVLPDQPHLVEPMGPMQMVVEFYDQDPGLPRS